MKSSMFYMPRFYGNRAKAYVNNQEESGKIAPIIYDLIRFCENIDTPSLRLKKYAEMKSINLSTVEIATNNILYGRIGEDDDIVAILTEAGCACGYRLTHSEVERSRIKHLMLEFNRDEESERLRDLFTTFIYCMIKDHMMIACKKGNFIEGMVFDPYPGETYYIDDGFVSYEDKAKAFRVIDSDAYSEVLSAIERGCELEDVIDILPEDPHARMFLRKYDEYELSQIAALNKDSKHSA